MKTKTFDILTYVVAFIIAAVIAISIVEYREARNDAYQKEHMCNISDARLVTSGMIDCRGVREWKK